jgi:hypothetical protein
MFLQDNDPHHLHADPTYLYAFFILAPILSVLILFVGWKLMNYLENRKMDNQMDKKDYEPASEKGERSV